MAIVKDQPRMQVQHKGRTYTVVTLRCGVCRRIIPVQTAAENTFTLTEVACGALDVALRGHNGYEPNHITCIEREGGRP